MVTWGVWFRLCGGSGVEGLVIRVSEFGVWGGQRLGFWGWEFGAVRIQFFGALT